MGTKLNQGKRVGVLGLPEFLDEADSEDSDTESPRFEAVVSGGASQGAPSGVGKAPIEEEEEEEEENPNVYFKQKWKDSPPPKPHKKQVVKKARRPARETSTAGDDESVAYITSPVS